MNELNTWVLLGSGQLSRQIRWEEMNEGNERKFEIQVDEAILSTVLDI